MVKIAAISDIHANLPALEAVLEDIARLRCDSLIVAGDFINCGPWPGETIRLLRSMNTHFILGNHEGYVLDHILGKHKPQPPWRALFLPGKWAAAQLTQEEKKWLIALPERLELPGPDGSSIVVVHGSPIGINRGITQDLTEEKLTNIFEGEIRPKRLFISGHTHRQALHRWKDMTIANCGSVGYSLDGKGEACYLVAEWVDKDWQVQLRRIHYNKEASLNRIAGNADHNEAGPLMWFIHHIVRTGLSAGMSSFVKNYSALGDYPEPPHDLAHLEERIKHHLSQH